MPVMPARRLGLEPPLFLQTLELDLGVIGELHRAGDRVMAGDVGDQTVHLLADAAVRRMPLRRRAQLDHVHRLARVHVHDESHAIRHRHGVLRRDAADRRSTSASYSSADRSMTSRQSASPPASTIASGCV